MLLRSVRVENFRAVRGAAVSLDPTTVFIGENDCGRSSIMEAIAIALGWNSENGEFRFQPYHFHRDIRHPSTIAPSISITLEFAESAADEWSGENFEVLRAALPGVFPGERRFSFEIKGDEGAAIQWIFRSAGQATQPNDLHMLEWLRRRMPVFWLREGVASGGIASRRVATASAGGLAGEVTRHYRDLLEGTAPDIQAAIESGSVAARQMLAGAKLVPGGVTPLTEVLEEITGRPSARRTADVGLPHGSGAHKLAVLLLVGAAIRSGVGQVEQGSDPLTLIENPEANLHPMTMASIWSVIDRIRGQKIVATHSGTVLASARLSSVRRLTRHDGLVKEWRVPEGVLSADELRRYSYHLRSRRASANFARCWLLVEGETEFWLMSELARVCGYDFAGEGVSCVEFAQCGLPALIKVAQYFGIEWHLLADGDAAGQNYVRAAAEFAAEVEDHVTLLEERDIEHCFWRYGYAHVFRRAAYPDTVASRETGRAPAKGVIRHALERYSKPYMAALLMDAVIACGPQGVPKPLRKTIETCVRLARHGPAAPQKMRVQPG